MNRRALLGVLAFVLALAGGVLIYFYVKGADARALAQNDLAPVVVVTKEVPAGTTVAGLTEFVETRQLPQVAIVPDAVKSLAALPKDDVAVTALKVGEQVLASRFAAPDSAEIQAPVPVPEGMQLVSIQLSPERVVGSQITAGSKVGLFVTLAAPLPGQASAEPTKNSDGTTTQTQESATKLMANDVLVVRVQGAPTSTATQDPNTGETLPGSEVIVTLAVKAPLAERIVYAKEHGSIWLSLQQPTTETTGNDGVTSGNVFK